VVDKFIKCNELLVTLDELTQIDTMKYSWYIVFTERDSNE